MMIAVVLGFWATLGLARGTPIGRFLAWVMIDSPIRLIARLTRGHVILAAFLLVITGLVVWFGASDGARMLAMGVPDLLGWATAFEITTYLDVAVAAVLTSSVLKVRAIVYHARHVLTLARRRSVRVRRRPACPPPGNDDEHGWRFAVAA